jgi:predicted enzyme related to lactoylglutathione lyase
MENYMAKVLGVGGVFFKSPDPKKLYEWYTKWLGMEFEGSWGIAFYLRDMPENSQTVWSAFPATTDYFEPSEKEFMFNLVVDNVEEALKQVKDGGGQVTGEIQEMEYGRFGWFIDPDGNKVELWQPIKKEAE